MVAACHFVLLRLAFGSQTGPDESLAYITLLVSGRFFTQGRFVLLRSHFQGLGLGLGLDLACTNGTEKTNGDQRKEFAHGIPAMKLRWMNSITLPSVCQSRWHLMAYTPITIREIH